MHTAKELKDIAMKAEPKGAHALLAGKLLELAKAGHTSTHHMETLSDRDIDFLVKQGFEVAPTLNDTYFISWDN